MSGEMGLVICRNCEYIPLSHVLPIETVCMLKKERDGDVSSVESGVRGERRAGEEEGGMEEEMEEVKAEGTTGTGRSVNVRDKWMPCHEVTPLATALLSSGGVRSVNYCQSL